MALLNLFLAFFRIGMTAFGGAYSFLPLIEKEVVERYHWLTREEFLDMVGASKIFPGALSIKYATYTGYKVSGLPGVVLANLGNMLPPVALMLLASVFYIKYKDLPRIKGAFNMIQLAVYAMILALTFQLISVGELMQFKNMLIIAVSFILFLYTKVHPAVIIIGAGALGAFLR